MTTQTLTRVWSKLTDLQEHARDAHLQCLSDQDTYLVSFYVLGESLIDVKECTPHGEFLPWLEDEAINPRTAQRAMRIAKYDTVSFLQDAGSVSIALAAIAERGKPEPELLPVDGPEEPVLEPEGIERHTFVRAQSGNDDWYSPGWLVEACRTAMGEIDLDPASCDHAQKTVKASTYYTKEDNGLDQHWSGTVFINPSL